jgi:hypothetical protein
MSINYWKWSVGEPYYKSPRKDKDRDTNTNKNTANTDYGYEEGDQTTQQLSFDSGQNAIAQSLAFTDINELSYSRNSDNENKREYLDNKISDRELIGQRGTNPFSMQTSYVNDVVTRDMFLKPINTTQGQSRASNKTSASE